MHTKSAPILQLYFVIEYSIHRTVVKNIKDHKCLVLVLLHENGSKIRLISGLFHILTTSILSMVSEE